ncbi:MAG: O-antigen ligase family protein [Gemmatimonadota bacterium]|nr:O-antigen ligase family protein [Gemmatimonadota bacterium]
MSKAARENRKKMHGAQGAGSGVFLSGLCSRAVVWTFYSGLFLGAAVFAPQYFYNGFETPKLFVVSIAAGLIAFFWLLAAVSKRETVVRLPVCAACLGAAALVAVLSIGWSLNRGLALERLYHLSALAVWGLFAWGLYRGKSIKGPLYFIIFLGTAIAAWGLLLDIAEPLRKAVYPNLVRIEPNRVIDLYRRLISNQGNPNFLFHVLVLTTPAALGAFIREAAAAAGSRNNGSSPKRYAWLAACVTGFAFLVQLVCFFFSQNRSGMFSVAAALLFFSAMLVVFKRTQLKKALSRYLKGFLCLTAGFAVVLICLVWFTDSGRSLASRAKDASAHRLQNWRVRLSNLGDTDNIDVYSRVVFLEAGARMIADDPVLGKGIGQFVIYYPGCKTVKHWEKFPLLQPPIKRWAEIPPQVHNEYLQLAIELGAPALAFFLAFWLFFAGLFWRCLKRQSGSTGFYLLLGAGAGLLGTLFNSLFTFPLQTVTSGTFFWTVTGLLLAGCAGEPGEGVRGGCREFSLRLPLDKPVARIAAVSTALLVLVACLWGSTRIIRGQYLFFDSLKHHARKLDYSIRRNSEAGRLLPHRFEIQYVQGWLNQLKGDTASARVHYEKAIVLAPYFPEPYRYLTRIYYSNHDYTRAEELLVRYDEIYTPGPRGTPQYIWGLIALRDTTRDRIEEAGIHLRKVGSNESLMDLADAYYKRGRLDSTLALVETVSSRVSSRADPELYLQVCLYYGRVALAAGDTARAREELGKVVRDRHSGEKYENIKATARGILEELDREK